MKIPIYEAANIQFIPSKTPGPYDHTYLLCQLFEAITLPCCTVSARCNFHLTHVTIKAVRARAECYHQLLQRV
jgi:hypothetical protein